MNSTTHLTDHEASLTATGLYVTAEYARGLERQNQLLRNALNKLLRNQGNVEVMGEWEALEINRSMLKSARAKQQQIEDECFAALSPHPAIPHSPVVSAGAPSADGVGCGEK